MLTFPILMLFFDKCSEKDKLKVAKMQCAPVTGKILAFCLASAVLHFCLCPIICDLAAIFKVFSANGLLPVHVV